MSARRSVQSSHGMGEDPLAAASATSMQTQGKRDESPAGGRDERDAPEPRVSPDPMQGTDRYRLVMPFNLRL
jgi:hypothetical protein